ncbi:type-1 angiotensin II receptor A [Hemibagrus wyckioides]|uniref:type-1 angiotensin II receptor A n=1 Tax=Hemibagrus wyckioides TaxID=337641 RepID=UPI00266CA16B|nr:type-1 angiotensin II receptor A [Hemibagrus wyckioides]XP_058246452.1 type-1 angiotensin II receptor A [Hemibagrus wyckioides]
MENLTAESNEILPLKCNMTGSHNFIFTFVPVVYACNFIIGMVGNSMVVAVIYRYMKLKTVANVFVLNLAVSDLTFLVTLPMWATFTALGYHWPFGSFLCKASAGLAIFNLYTSIFFLTALSVDRYLAIVHPMGSRRRRTLLYARITCVLVWVFAFVLSMPTALSRDIYKVKDHPSTLCGIWSNKQIHLLVSLSILKSVLGFLVPFLIIITCDCLMGCALLKAKGLLRKSTRSREDETLRMLAAAVLAFFVCWAPHQVFHFMELLAMLGVVKDCHVLDLIDTAMPFSICLAYFNSCVNPILYSFVGHNFRKNLLRLLHCESSPVTRNSSLSTKMTALSTRASQVLRLSSKKDSEYNANTVEEPKT